MRSSSNIQRVVNPQADRFIPERPNPMNRLREIGNRNYMPAPTPTFKSIPGRRQIPEEDFRLAALRRRLGRRTYS